MVSYTWGWHFHVTVDPDLVMNNDFSRLAPVYDCLSYLVFGRAIRRAQEQYLNEFKQPLNILILGGGTGWILSSLDKLGYAHNVTYIDASSTMISRSIRRQPFDSIQVEFIVGSVLEIPDVQYDLIITNFFLDLFKPETLPVIMKKIHACKKPLGLWICTDFVNTRKTLHKALIKIMYWFFRITTSIEGATLLDFHSYFLKMGMVRVRNHGFYGKMISASLYKTDTR